MIEDHHNVFFTTNYMDLEVLCTGEPAPDYSEQQWKELFREHPDRFVFAFDRVFETQWRNYTRDMSYFRDKLSDLPYSVTRALVFENARRLFFSDTGSQTGIRRPARRISP